MEKINIIRKPYILLICTILCTAVAAGPLFAQVEARVLEAVGKAELKAPGGNWQPAGVGDALPPGTIVSTGFNGRLVLDVGGSDLVVQKLTRLTLEELVRRGDTINTRLNLSGFSTSNDSDIFYLLTLRQYTV